MNCGDDSTGIGGGIATPFAPGRYQLFVELAVDRKPVTMPIGTLVADANGELNLSPR